MKIKVIIVAGFLKLMALQGCTDNAITDSFVNIPNQHWTHAQPIISLVEITDNKKKYNILLNLRHTDEYKYANIWFKVNIISPNKTKKTERIEFSIASADGAWLGNTTGSLYTYQLPYKLNFTFPSNGKYTIVVEQNMRDNPLLAINDVGIRVESIEKE